MRRSPSPRGLRTAAPALAALAACGSHGDRTPPKDAAPRPIDAAPIAWSTVELDHFTVPFPVGAIRDDDGTYHATIDGITYKASGGPAPAWLLATASGTVNGQTVTFEQEESSGTRLSDQAWDVYPGKGHLRVYDLGGDVRDEVGVLIAGRWRLELRVRARKADLPRAGLDKLYYGVKVADLGRTHVKSWPCEALLLEICERCGDTSPACQFRIDPGATPGACADQSLLMSHTDDDAQAKECAVWTKAKRVDLSSLE